MESRRNGAEVLYVGGARPPAPLRDQFEDGFESIEQHNVSPSKQPTNQPTGLKAQSFDLAPTEEEVEKRVSKEEEKAPKVEHACGQLVLSPKNRAPLMAHRPRFLLMLLLLRTFAFCPALSLFVSVGASSWCTPRSPKETMENAEKGL